MKKLILKYLLEFIVIVFGVSLSFYVENYIENKERWFKKSISKQNPTKYRNRYA